MPASASPTPVLNSKSRSYILLDVTEQFLDAMADELYELELLSLVAKITQEVLNHTGINDKTLAEFIIALHDDSKTLPDFKRKLKDTGADFPESFIENID